MTNEHFNILKSCVYKLYHKPYKEDAIQDIAIKLLRQDENKLTKQYIYTAVVNYIKDYKNNYTQLNDNYDYTEEDKSDLRLFLDDLKEDQIIMIEDYLEAKTFKNLGLKWNCDYHTAKRRLLKIFNDLKK